MDVCDNDNDVETLMLFENDADGVSLSVILLLGVGGGVMVADIVALWLGDRENDRVVVVVVETLTEPVTDWETERVDDRAELEERDEVFLLFVGVRDADIKRLTDSDGVAFVALSVVVTLELTDDVSGVRFKEAETVSEYVTDPDTDAVPVAESEDDAFDSEST